MIRKMLIKSGKIGHSYQVRLAHAKFRVKRHLTLNQILR